MEQASQRFNSAANVIKKAVQSGQYPGIVVMLANQTQTLWTHLESGTEPVALNQLFPIASITKPIIATAIMRLVERGYLLLSDPVTKFIPEFGHNNKEKVLIWHLLTHTSGLDEPEEVFQNLFENRAGVQAWNEAAYQVKVQFEPGSKYQYCNLAFCILAEVITRLSGLAYPRYLEERIFKPLGMRDTAFFPVDLTRAAPVAELNQPEIMDYYKALAFPAGGLWSSACDLTVLGQTLLNKGKSGNYRLLSPAALATMTRYHTTGLPVPAYAGLGWGKRSPRGVRLASESSFGHGGSSGCFLWIDPEWDLVFVLMSREGDATHNGAQRTLNAIYGALD